MSQAFAQVTGNGSSALETVQSRHCSMISQSQVIQVYLPLQYLSFSFCDVKRYVKNERDKMAVEADPDQIYTKKKENKSHEQLSFGRISQC